MIGLKEIVRMNNADKSLCPVSTHIKEFGLQLELWLHKKMSAVDDASAGSLN